MTTVVDKLRGRRPSGVNRDALRAAADALSRVSGLPLDTSRLDESSQRQFVELARKARTEAGGVNLSALSSRERAELDRLVDTVADGELSRSRDAEHLRRETRRLARLAVLPDPRPRFEEPGSWTIPAAWFGWSRRGRLPLDALAVFLFVAAQLETGEAWGAHSRIEPGADGLPTLTVDNVTGVGGRWDPFTNIAPGWRRSLDWLAANDFLDVERRGREVSIRYGHRALAARRGPDPGKQVAR